MQVSNVFLFSFMHKICIKISMKMPLDSNTASVTALTLAALKILKTMKQNKTNSDRGKIKTKYKNNLQNSV